MGKITYYVSKKISSNNTQDNVHLPYQRGGGNKIRKQNTSTGWLYP